MPDNKNHVELNYLQYNGGSMGMFVVVFLIYANVIFMLSNILEGHIYKKINFCNPRFYYDAPCQNLIVEAKKCKKDKRGKLLAPENKNLCDNLSKNMTNENFTTVDAIREDKDLVKTQWTDKVRAFRQDVLTFFIEPALVKVVDPFVRRFSTN